MQVNRMPRPEREDESVQRAVLSLALEAHPKSLAIPDLALEFDQGDAVERAVRDLVGVGLSNAAGSRSAPAPPRFISSGWNCRERGRPVRGQPPPLPQGSGPLPGRDLPCAPPLHRTAVGHLERGDGLPVPTPRQAGGGARSRSRRSVRGNHMGAGRRADRALRRSRRCPAWGPSSTRLRSNPGQAMTPQKPASLWPMAEKRPKQKTEKGLEIPVPTKGDFDAALEGRSASRS